MKLPLSYHQERLWSAHVAETGALYPQGPVYHNIPLLVEMEGPVQPEALRRSVESVISQYEILRTRIGTGGQAVQCIGAPPAFDLPVVALEPGTGRQAALDAALAYAGRPFGLPDDLLVRGVLFRLAADRHLLVLVLHHLVADRYSVRKIAGEIFAAYPGGPAPAAADAPLQYADFAQWQRELPAEVLEQLLFYWNERLGDKGEDLLLPTDHPRAAVQIFRAERVSFMLPDGLAARIRAFADEQGVSAHDFFLAAFKVLLFRYTAQGAISVGISTDNRAQPGTEDIVGPVANLLATRTPIGAADSFLDVLNDVQQEVGQAIRFGDLPFERLVAELRRPADPSRTPLFDVLFGYEESPLQLPEIPGLRTHVVETNLGWGKYDYHLHVQADGPGYHGVLVYNGHYFSEAAGRRLAGHYRGLLEAVLDDPRGPVGRLAYLPEAERQLLLETWNDTRADYPRETLYALFAAQAARTPGNVAVQHEHTTVDYRTLHQRSNRLGNYLRQQYGVQPNELVAICLERSEKMIEGLLGILRASGAYVPVDPGYPVERIRYILHDSASRLLLTTTDSAARTEGFAGTVVYLDTLGEAVYDNPAYDEAPLVNTPDDTAYVIYTSGTTGQPKGCMISHRNVVRLMRNDRHPFDFGPDDVWIMAHSFCFDVSVWEMYGALLYGARLVVPAWEAVRDVAQFNQLLRRHRVTVLNQTPRAFYNLIADELKQPDQRLDDHLRYVIFAGDKLEPAYLKPWVRHYPLSRVVMANLFGITETTVHVTFHRLTDADIDGIISPVGGPLPEYTLYLLDEQLQPVPVGVTGELYVGGTGLAKGYLHKPELTASRFIDHPFAPGQKLYRSGDLGRWLENGTIEYFGRKDLQVKIRGYRIELGEIENNLLAYPGVKSVVVVCRKDAEGEHYLAAYLTADAPVPAAELRSHLLQHLPDYMVPAYFVRLDALPLNNNNKLDRAALPDPQQCEAPEAAAYAAPRNEREAVLLSLYQEVLKQDRAGVSDNFFELGGHSLKATQLVARIGSRLGVKVTLRQVFDHPTVAQLAEAVAHLEAGTAEAIGPVATQPYYPVSHAQKRLWILDALEGGSAAYNMPGAYLLEGELDVVAFRAAFARLTDRHEILRTTFPEVDGEPVQWVAEPGGDDELVACTDLRTAEDPLAAAHRLAEEEGRMPFDLGRGRLLRVKLLHTGAGQYVLLFTIHHIIADGWSVKLLIEEALALYQAGVNGEADRLPPLTIQYKDFAAWQHRQLAGDTMQAHRRYWLAQLDGELPVLQLPTDHPRPLLKTYNGNTVPLLVEPALLDALQRVSQDNGCTLFMNLMASVTTLLHRYTGQNDLLVGTPTAGRGHYSLENQVGFYVNTLPIRTRPDGRSPYRHLLDQVRQSCLAAFEHQVYPFDRLVEDLALARDPSRSPLVDVMVVLNDGDPLQEIRKGFGPVRVQPFAVARPTSKFDLTFGFTPTAEGLRLDLEYNTDLFTEARIRQMIAHYHTLLASIAGSSTAPLCDLNYFTPGERDQLLNANDLSAVPYPRLATIHRLFESQAARTPAARAVTFGDKTLSYRELNEQANQLAHYLVHAVGVQPGDLVGLLVERSERMITTLLAVLKAGAAYVPIDAEYPEERVRYTLADAGVRVLILDEAGGAGRYQLPDCTQVLLREHGADIAACPVTNLADRCTPADLAYIIYTSGSTGKPKGVMVEHRNMVRLLFNENFGDPAGYDFGQNDVWTVFHSICFDFSVWEMFGALLLGGRLVVVAKETAQSPALYVDLLEREGVTVMNQVPTVFNHLTAEVLTRASCRLAVRYVIFGGEALNPISLRPWRALYPACRLVNMYGITETTVHVTFKEIGVAELASGLSNIGKPIPTLSVCLMDAYRQLTPAGYVGEIMVGGAGVARGYLHRPELTAERFIEHPYRAGERLYCSGDLGLQLPDGELVYLGRKDTQVKVRGYRIELGEVKSGLLRHPQVEDALVRVQVNKQGHNELVAYLVAANGPTVAALRAFLGEFLPAHMLPAHFVPLAAFPLTANGKIDFRALPAPDDAPAGDTAYAPPANDRQQLLTEAWSEVLGKTGIGIEDDFFALGGDSIKAIQITSRLHRAKYKLSIRDFFRYPTVRELSERIVFQGRVPDQSPAAGPVALTPIQRQFFAGAGEYGHHFNQAALLAGDPYFDPAATAAVFGRIQAHHDALRLTFHADADGVTAAYGPADLPLSLETFDLRADADPAGTMQAAMNRLQAGIDLQRGPLMKTGLFRMPEKDYLLVVIHHLAVDGVSWRILLEDVAQLYKQYEKNQSLTLPLKSDAYGKWADALLAYAGSDALRQELPYWENLERMAARAGLPKDAPAGSNRVKDTRRTSFTLSPEDTELLTGRVHAAFNTETADLLLAALGLGFRRTFGLNHLLIAMEGHGREDLGDDVDVSRTVGWFTSVFPLLLTTTPDGDPVNQVKEVKEQLRRIPNKGIGYGILRYLGRPEATAARPLRATPEISFNFLGDFDKTAAQLPFRVDLDRTGNQVSPDAPRPYVLDVSGMITGGRLTMHLDYNGTQYGEATMRTCWNHCCQELTRLIGLCAARDEQEATPSDFLYGGLSLGDLDGLFS